MICGQEAEQDVEGICFASFKVVSQYIMEDLEKSSRDLTMNNIRTENRTRNHPTHYFVTASYTVLFQRIRC
jgi:hypothetical protein